MKKNGKSRKLKRLLRRDKGSSLGNKLTQKGEILPVSALQTLASASALISTDLYAPTACPPDGDICISTLPEPI